MPVFLNTIGRNHYALLRNLLSPEKPAQKPLKDLMDMLREYFGPKKVVIASHFQFHQRPGETVAMFLAELHKLAVPRAFDDVLDEALRDRLVCGLREEAHQKRLLPEVELTLNKALLIAQRLETVDVNAHALREQESEIQQLSKCTYHEKAPVQQKKGPHAFITD